MTTVKWRGNLYYEADRYLVEEMKTLEEPAGEPSRFDCDGSALSLGRTRLTKLNNIFLMFWQSEMEGAAIAQAAHSLLAFYGHSCDGRYSQP